MQLTEPAQRMQTSATDEESRRSLSLTPDDYTAYPPIKAVRPLSDSERAAIMRHLYLHGSSPMAYSALQDGLDYFIDEELGFFSFMPLKHPIFALRGINVIIADPVAAPENYEALLDAYLASSQAKATAFIEIGKDFADILQARGYPVNELGVEWEIDLPDFDFELRGQNFSHLRRWRNKARKEGVEVIEGPISRLLAESPQELHELNEAWLKRKGGHEFVGLTRPLCLDDHPHARCFWARRNGRLISLAVFDPMFRDNRVIGYLHNLSRVTRDAPHGTNDLIVIEAMRIFRDEGCEVLSLGLSPFAELKDEDYSKSRFASGLFRFMFEHCQFVYPFKGNYFHKQKYRGRSFQTYISAMPALNLYRILGIFKTFQIL